MQGAHLLPSFQGSRLIKPNESSSSMFRQTCNLVNYHKMECIVIAVKRCVKTYVLLDTFLCALFHTADAIRAAISVGQVKGELRPHDHCNSTSNLPFHLRNASSSPGLACVSLSCCTSTVHVKGKTAEINAIQTARYILFV